MAIELDTERKRYSNYVVSTQRTVLNNQCSKRVTVKAAGTDAIVDPLGLPVIWDNTDSFIPYENTSDISALTTEPAGLGGAVVGIVVGSSEGEGHNLDDVTVTAAGVEMTVLFRDSTINGGSIDWAWLDVDGVAANGVTAALAAKQLEFTNQLEKQRVNVVDKATVVDPNYVA